MSFLGVYGHVNVDHILIVKHLPGVDQTVPVERELVRLGGTGGNLARAAAALGVPVALSAVIGSDFPPELRQQLSASPIELVDLRTVEGPTPKIWILSIPGGAQSGVIDQGVMGDGLSRPRRDYTMLNSQWVHFTTGPADEHYEMAREASRIGKRVTFDPAQELDYRYTPRSFERFLDESDVFMCNEPELARGLAKLNYGDASQLLDHTDAVVVTRGAKGCTLITQKRKVDVPACPIRGPAPQEAVGAGDVFRAGWYLGLHRGENVEASLRWGAVAASLYLETQGQGFPDPAALEARRLEWRT